MEKARISADEALKNIPDEGTMYPYPNPSHDQHDGADNVWKERFLQRQEGNKNLQKQLDDMDGNSAQEEGDVTLESLSDVALKHLQRKLEKDKAEMEWKLKEYGWRLDQASTVSMAIW